jgi:hypothetical protein
MDETRKEVSTIGVSVNKKLQKRRPHGEHKPPPEDETLAAVKSFAPRAPTKV